MFVVTGFIHFLDSSRWVGVYDEGITLTGAMRVAAGQVVHRDFYYNYGLANIYVMAGLFKIFGESVLVVRVMELIEAASMVAVIYFILERFAGRIIAAGAVIGCLLWPETLSWMSLCMLVSTWIIAASFQNRMSKKLAFWGGLLAAGTLLFRYDVGIASAGAQAILILAACLLRERKPSKALREAVTLLAPYFAGFAVVVAPLFLWFWADGILPGLIYDVVIYPSKYYYAGRNLPFPHIHRQNFYDIIVYVFPLLMAVIFFQIVRWLTGWLRRRIPEGAPPSWFGPLVSFGLIAAIMYIKALVRIGAGALFLCSAACIILGGVLIASRRSFDSISKVLITVLLALFAIGGVSMRWHDLTLQREKGASMAAWFLRHNTQAPYPPFREWCNDNNAFSKGLCFFNDNDHIQAIDYIESHTKPSDTLYVGLSHHDRVIVNDNITYFATQRLPATKWSHFDPFEQNRSDIQLQMIEEFKRNQPPYIVLDSEFDNFIEPNGSSVSTGVHLLDDYIAANYLPAVTFGELQILHLRNRSQ
ncbi:MAG TPA: hypothetical protein VFW30_07905 [Bryocella sp.]|nr:hypothetical protein [Bryocella sp.]